MTKIISRGSYSSPRNFVGSAFKKKTGRFDNQICTKKSEELVKLFEHVTSKKTESRNRAQHSKKSQHLKFNYAGITGSSNKKEKAVFSNVKNLKNSMTEWCEGKPAEAKLTFYPLTIKQKNRTEHVLITINHENNTIEYFDPTGKFSTPSLSKRYRFGKIRKKIPMLTDKKTQLIQTIKTIREHESKGTTAQMGFTELSKPLLKKDETSWDKVYQRIESLAKTIVD